MGSIVKRKGKNGTTYWARVRRKGLPPKQATFRRKTDAEAWIWQEEQKIPQGRYLETVEASKYTLSEAINRYCKDLDPTPIRRTHLNRWKDALGAIFLSQLTHFKINEILDKWSREKKTADSDDLKYQGATLNRHRNSLSVVLETARKRWGWITSNPCKLVVAFEEPKGRVRFLSDDERKKLLEECQKSDCKYLHAAVILAIATGMRKAEILNLKWSMIDLQRGTIVLEKTKNKTTRCVHLKGHALELLRRRSKIRRIDSEYLFPGTRTGKVIATAGDRPFTIRKAWDKAIKDAGIPNFRFHDLRHTTASYLAMNGATLFEIKEAMGHKTTQATERYAHLTDSHVASVVESMNKKIFG